MRVLAGTFGSRAVTFVLLAAILVLANLLALPRVLRWDLTEDDRYSLSDATKELLRELPDILTCKFYFSENLPQHLEPLRENILDTLQEMRAYAPDRFLVEEQAVTIKEQGDDMHMRLTRAGIEPVATRIEGEEGISLRWLALGLVFQYGGRSTALPVIEAPGGGPPVLRMRENVEYELIRKLLDVTKAKRPKVAFLQGSGQPPTYENPFTQSGAGNMQHIVSMIEDRCTVEAADLSMGQLVPEDARLLIAMGVHTPLKNWEKFAIDQHLMRGGNLLLVLCKVEVTQPYGDYRAERTEHGLEDLLRHYGIELPDQLVFDEQCEMRYPMWVIINTHDGVNRDHPITAKIRGSFDLFWPSPIEFGEVKHPDWRKEPLVFSSTRSDLEDALTNVTMRRNWTFPEEGTRHCLAALVSGRFHSLFADQPVPDRPTGAPPQDEEAPVPEIITDSPGAKILIVTTTPQIFYLGNLPMQFWGNQVFLQNAIDYLLLDERLIGIRAKSIGRRQLEHLSDKEEFWLTVGCAGAVPALVILFGLGRFLFRIRMRAARYRPR